LSLGIGASFITPSNAATTAYYAEAANVTAKSKRTAEIATISNPTITGNTPANRCGTGTVTLGATASAGTINWYTENTGGSSVATGSSFTTPSLSSTTNYVATGSSFTTPSLSSTTNYYVDAKLSG